jgi:hypothetical protein
MRDFVERLERGLVQAAEQEAQRSAPGRLARSARALPLGYRNLTALATAAVLAVALVISTGPSPNPTLAALPVLSRPATNASAVRPYVPVLSKSGARFGDARAIQTPYGRGYVIPAPNRGLLCLAIPDTVPRSYGETCTPVDQAERTGIVATLISPRGGSASSEFVGVFPDDASRPEVTHRDGRVTRLALHDGVAAATFDEDVTVTVHVGKSVQTVAVPAHEPEGAGFADCGGGRIVREPRGQTAHDVCRGK